MLPAQTGTPGPALVQEGRDVTNTACKMPGLWLQQVWGADVPFCEKPISPHPPRYRDKKKPFQTGKETKATNASIKMKLPTHFNSMAILGPIVRPPRLRKSPAPEAVPIPKDREKGGERVTAKCDKLYRATTVVGFYLSFPTPNCGENETFLH